MKTDTKELDIMNKEILNFIANNRINQIEIFLGSGDRNLGAKRLKDFLSESASHGLMPATMAKIMGKDRHVLHQWYRRYNISGPDYNGFKKSIIFLEPDPEKHSPQYSNYIQLEDKTYRGFYIYPTPLLAYFVGLILGDGSVDSRKLYITGGGSYGFLDSFYMKALEFAKYLGNRKVLIKYYDEFDREIPRNKNGSTWRVYFYWSALSNLFRNKRVLETSLEKIWNDPELFDAFTAGLFDADGYFVLKKGIPERIGIEQRQNKLWFNNFVKRLETKYSIRIHKRTRKYSITKPNGKVYRGTTNANIVRFTMRSWPEFIDNAILKFSNKPKHRERALLFKEKALGSKNRWR